MTVRLSAAMSIVLRKDAVVRQGRSLEELIATLGSPASQDKDIVVFGPYFETKDISEKLDAAGFEYFVDYFDIAHSGGPVPEWCELTLSLRQK